jgi:hypothetical protein
MAWIREQMEKGDTRAAERLFRPTAGLNDEQRIDLAREMMTHFRRMNPRALARSILGLPRRKESDQLLWRLVTEWSREDAEEALRFIETLPADRLNSPGVLHNSAGALARLPAERVLALAAKLDTKGRAYLAEGLVGVSDQMGAWRNTTTVLANLNAPFQNETLAAERHLGNRLAQINPQAFESQIAAETDAARRDALLEGYAWATGFNDPPRGLELDAQIENPEAQKKNIRHHTEHWLESDRAAALAWLQSDAAGQLMTREERAKLLRLYHLEAAR